MNGTISLRVDSLPNISTARNNPNFQAHSRNNPNSNPSPLLCCINNPNSCNSISNQNPNTKTLTLSLTSSSLRIHVDLPNPTFKTFPSLSSSSVSSSFHGCPLSPPSLSPSPSPSISSRSLCSRRRGGVHVAAMADRPGGILGRLGKVLKEKAKADFERVFKGVTKTREGLAVVDELLSYWNLSDAEGMLDELEEALLIADFGPKTSIKLVNILREEVGAGKLKSGVEIKLALKREILKLLTENVASTELQLPESRPAVIMIVGVNGGGKTTTLGKLAHRFQGEGLKVLMAAGDTFRAAASEQLAVWAERTGSLFVRGEGEKPRPSSVLSQGVRKAIEMEIDIFLGDTSGRLHTNDRLMGELQSCKKAIEKVLPGAPHEILMVLDGTTGLNMLPQAREFNQVMGVTGFVLTKLDGTSRGGCVASVVDELGIPVKFVGVGEGLDDLQPFDAEAFVNALFPT